MLCAHRFRVVRLCLILATVVPAGALASKPASAAVWRVPPTGGRGTISATRIARSRCHVLAGRRARVHERHGAAKSCAAPKTTKKSPPKPGARTGARRGPSPAVTSPGIKVPVAGGEPVPGAPGPEGALPSEAPGGPGASSEPPGDRDPVASGPSHEPPVSDEPAAPFRFFAPTSFWNEPLPADAPLDQSSLAIVGAFDRVVANEESARTGPWINTTSWSVPIYTVPGDQPTVEVQIVGANAGESALQSAWSAVPLPVDAKPAQGTDGHLVVWQPSTDRLWEFWRLVHGTAGWQASWGGAMQDASSDPGVYGQGVWAGSQAWWGASASSLSIAGGLITLEDLEDGVINHALALAIPNVRSGVYASPAQRDDGTSTDPLSLPEGARLRLDPHLDLTTLRLPKLTLMIAEAAQRYGIIVRDAGPNLSFYAQDPTPIGTEPYKGKNGYFENRYPNQVLASFPWEHLQLLKMELHPNGHGSR